MDRGDFPQELQLVSLLLPPLKNPNFPSGLVFLSIVHPKQPLLHQGAFFLMSSKNILEEKLRQNLLLLSLVSLSLFFGTVSELLHIRIGPLLGISRAVYHVLYLIWKPLVERRCRLCCFPGVLFTHFLWQNQANCIHYIQKQESLFLKQFLIGKLKMGIESNATNLKMKTCGLVHCVALFCACHELMSRLISKSNTRVSVAKMVTWSASRSSSM